MLNFMCHKRLIVELCPNLNFIVGHNGSGKSAVLTAITIALGGKASSTNRASSLKSFIKSGETGAEIIVRLRNRGEEAYQNDVYGDSITVVRRINIDGGGSWRILDENGKTRSTHRSDLSRILDHLDIQVDNPMSVLNQDAAKGFLAASNPEQKYALFLKGTQLTHLAQEMDTLKDHNLEIKAVLSKQKEYLPDLKAEYQEKLQKFAQFEKQREGKQKLEELSDLYVWAQVAQAKRAYEHAEEEVRKQASKITKAQQAAQTVSQELDEVDHTLSLIDQERAKDRAADDNLITARDEARAKVNEAKAAHDSVGLTLQDTNEQYTQSKNELQSAQRKLDNELQKESQAGERDVWLKQRSRCDAQAQELQGQMDELHATKDDLERRLAPMQEALSNLEADFARCARSESAAEQAVRAIKAASQDNLSAFGPSMPALVRAIKQETNWRNPPVGPIGSFIQLKDEFWLNIVESILDKDLNGFCVTNDHDRTLLLKITRRHRCASFVPILRGADDPFDYSSGEPDPSLTSLLRLCDFSSDYVKRQLIISRNIERTVLVRARAEGDRLLRSRNDLNVVYSADLFRITGGDRTSSSVTMNRPTGAHRLSKDNSAALAEAEATLRGRQEARQEARSLIAAKKAEIEDLRRQMGAVSTRTHDVHRQLRSMQTELSDLNGKLQAQTTVDVAVWQEMVDQAKQSMEEGKERFRVVNIEYQETAAVLAEAQELYEQARRRLGERDSAQAAIADAAEQEAQKRVSLRYKLTHLQTQLATYTTDLSPLAETAEGLKIDFEELVRQAKEHTGLEYRDVSSKVTMESVEKEIKAWEHYMDKMRSQTGGNIDAAKMEIEEAQHKLHTLENRIRKLDDFAKQLDRSFNDRWARWHFWRGVIALRARSLFTAHLEHRGFSGSLSFEHERQEADGRRRPGQLLIKVQTEHGPGASGRSKQLQKETKSLSGGEKSFSTICLLLSLWEAINCPIRCLDEFDVFMDSANRATSTKMIVDACKVNRRVQYVIISPQSMATTQTDKDTRVILLQDPRRNVQ